MQDTLLLISKDLIRTWVLGGWILFGVIYMIVQSRSRPWRQVLSDFGLVFVVATAFIYFVLPAISVDVVNPQDPAGPLIPGGLAIRGYGVFMMLALILSILLVVARCDEGRLPKDQVVALCMIMIVSGLIGARLFFVIQYWSDFCNGSLFRIFDMTQGGLVVYGSLIGGLIGTAIYLPLSGLPARRTLDVLAPAMVLGLAIGRIGCLMNGCCYGDTCGQTFPLGLSFPAGSPPYMRQIEEGKLLGAMGTLVEGEHDGNGKWLKVESLAESSPLRPLGLREGDWLRVYADPLRLKAQKVSHLNFDLMATVEFKRGGSGDPLLIGLPTSQLPDRSMRIHPTQIYASVNAFLLCALLYFLYPFRRFDGQVFAILMILYPITRYILEIIRADEGGKFGTRLSIGQWVSIAAVIAGFLVYIYFAARRPESLAETRPGADA